MANNTTTATYTTRRIHSTQTEHLREDLAAALHLVMSLNHAAQEHLVEAASIVTNLYHPQDKHTEKLASWLTPQNALRRVREVFGQKAFGVVALFSMEAQTSLAGDCEVLTSNQGLAWMNMTVRDLGWPQNKLHPAYGNDGHRWSEHELNTFQVAVKNWKQAHPDVTMRTVTAIGFWSGDEVIITGVIDGRHDVWGGTDKTGDGLFAESFTFDNTEPDPMATIYQAIAAKYYI